MMSETDLGRAWRTAVQELRRQHHGAALDMWIDDVRPLAWHDGVVRLGVPDAFVHELMSERFAQPLHAALDAACGRAVTVEFRIVGETPAAGNGHSPAALVPAPTAPLQPAPAASAPVDTSREGFSALPLNPRFTFENFVPGPSNRFPRAAAEAVAKAPARAYNPMFIYGGVGLGKTHLMQAVGHRAHQLYPAMHIAYVSGETFLHQFVTCIREDRMADFRARYRSVDLWLVDDIQFIASRAGTGTEAEFFHTFNALHATNKQIIVTSDRPPKELLFDDRLRSRFEWGLITDIKPPDEETRLAILQKRAQEEHLALSDEVLLYLAQVVRDSIRLLEGALLKVAAYASLSGETATVALARECLRDYSVGERPPALDAATIVELVARHFRLEAGDVRGKSRRADLVLARQVAMYLCREAIGSSFADIGARFERDHSTVMHSCTKVAECLARGDAAVSGALAALQSELEQQRSA